MPTCIDCERSAGGTRWPMFNPKCLWCGARLIQRLRELPRPPAEIKARQRTVLQDWMSFGHSKEELLRLSQTENPVAPGQPDSAAPSAEKPRSAKTRSPSESPSDSSTPASASAARRKPSATKG